MEISAQAVLARIFIDGNAMSGDQRLAEVVVQRAREALLAGATVLRGQRGFGQSHRFHGGGGFDLSEDSPVVIEIVDEEARLRPFVSRLGDLPVSLVTFEKVEIVWTAAARMAKP